ncbi:MAG: hypothetical protein J6112_00265 [Clostridia bacterium]|nr:hypothetical protein [Clostridia bacterium]
MTFVKRFACILLLFVSGCLVLSSCISNSTKFSGDSVFTGVNENKGRFNEGIVDYTLIKNETVSDAFPSDALGTLVSENDKGVEVIFSADFSSDDKTCGGEAVEYSPDSCSVSGGNLYIPAYAEGETAHGWTTWAPKAECFTDDYFGVQISFDCEISSDGKAVWSAPFIGLFKESLTSIADNNSGGLYLSLNDLSGTVTIYCDESGKWNWPQGNASIKLGGDALKGRIHVDIINVGREYVKLLINSEEVLRLVFRDDNKYELLDAEGTVAGSGKYDPEILKGPYFQIFSHLAIIGIENMTVYGFSKGVTNVDYDVEARAKDDFSLGLDITEKKDLISICYSVWHNAINGSGTGPIKNISDVTELLKTYDFTSESGFVNKTTGETSNALTKFHYWGRPAQGYYRSSDVSAIRNNMTLLYNAGVDFIILDLTYATAPAYAPGTAPWESYIGSSVTPLLDTIMQMRAEGKGTPYVVFWMGSGSMFPYIDEYFLSVEKWKDCFVYWNGKPFIMKWEMNSDETYEKWTVRGMYGLQGTASENQWSYLEIDNMKTVAYDKNGDPVHMCVDVATQETYMSMPTAHGRQGGRFFNQQWKNAFSVHPKIITVTWWNEWCAQLYYIDGVGYVFTDDFNEEYSRDIEPQDGANGSTYYNWLCGYISEYLSGNECPDLFFEN